MLTSTLRKSMSCVALASVLAISSACQKEALMEEQFASSTAVDSNVSSQVIAGQYIVVFKNATSGVSTQGVGRGRAGSRSEAATMRRRVYESAGVESSAVSQEYEGIVNGFAAKLTKAQLTALQSNAEVAYVEQDRLISLGKLSKTYTTKAGGGPNSNADSKGGGNGKNNPADPAPTDPAPTDPAPTDPAPEEPAPSVPAPQEPTPAPGYATITPLAGETIPWNIERVGYGDGTGKTIWIIDSGIDTDHPDLNVDIARCFSLIYGNPSFEDGFGHGTNVAGIIAAKNNGSGMIGIAANASVVALRVFDDAGAGTVSRALGAVNHVSYNGKPGDVVNMSIGAGTSFTLDDAVKAAAAKGILFAIAAGNSAIDCYQSSPARVDAPGVYTVSAMDIYNRLWDKSNFGAPVDFAAPGVDVTTTFKGGSFAGGCYGTSMSAPHVAGILLLRGTVYSQGTITGDKDNTPDPIASVK